MSGIYIPTLYSSFESTGTSNNVITGSPYYFITGISIALNSNSYASGATYCVFQFTDTSDGVIWGGGGFYLPPSGSLPSVVQANPSFSTPPGFFYKSSTIGSVLNIVPLTFGQTASVGYYLNIQYGYSTL